MLLGFKDFVGVKTKFYLDRLNLMQFKLIWRRGEHEEPQAFWEKNIQNRDYLPDLKPQ